MRLLLTLFLGLAVSLTVFAPEAEAQRRAMQERASPAPQGPNTQLAQPELEDTERLRCVLRGTYMTTTGLAFRCSFSNFDSGEVETHLVAFDGGSKPGGISAAMSLLVDLERRYPGEEHFFVRVKEPSAAAQDICNRIRMEANDRYECAEAIAFGG